MRPLEINTGEYADKIMELGDWRGKAIDLRTKTNISDVIMETRELFSEMDTQIDFFHHPIIQNLQVLLDSLAGKSFGSLEANEAIARSIQKMLLRLQLRVECPKCHEPAMLHFRIAGTSRHGSFQFKHHVNGHESRHLASTVLPALKLVPAPPDPRRKKKK